MTDFLDDFKYFDQVYLGFIPNWIWVVVVHPQIEVNMSICMFS
jgi:hypothetical protein